MTDILIVVDMQNDFVTGNLGTEEARAIVPAIADYIKSFDGDLYLTLDSHDPEKYPTSNEAKMGIPPHCAEYTEGWLIVREIMDASIGHGPTFVRKNAFGYNRWASEFDMDIPRTVTLVGVCTDICVISNAIAIKTEWPETEVRVVENLCAGSTPEAHQKAIDTMANCGIRIVGVARC